MADSLIHTPPEAATAAQATPDDQARADPGPRPVLDSTPRTPSPRPPVLLEDQAIHRVTLLAELQNALAAQGLNSLLVRNRRLVLRSDGQHADPSGPTDPQLHIFAPEGKDIATTDGACYHFASGQAHPADDPHGAALVTWHHQHARPWT